MANESLLVEIFGEENLVYFSSQKGIIDGKKEKLQELSDLRKRASDVFKVNLTYPDIAVSISAGVLLGIGNALFKDFIPEKGSLRHEHGTTRTGIDYSIPKPQGYKGSVNDLHRQIGPGHDIFRFKEALGLMNGKSSDFDLWGKNATDILGHELKPGNLKLDMFRELGGFKIPTDPKAELLNHLLIDFFTKRSLPIPGSSYIADSSPEMAKMMLKMYDNGLNLKTGLGNLLGYTLVQIIIHSYTFLFKAIPQSEFKLTNLSFDSANTLVESYIELTKKNEFHIMMMMSHGSSFLVDSIITLSSKSYAGLFQLNYLSLMAFSKHLLQYLIKNVGEYNKLIEETKSKANEISEIDVVWQTNFRSAFEKNFTDPNFQSIFDKDEWMQNSTRILNSTNTISDNLQREKLLLAQLKEM
ncbi:MAG: hypothetical protein ACYDEE_13535 [Ignavibacteriaceae bacterium]